MYIVTSNVWRGPTEVLMCTSTQQKAEAFVARENRTQPPGIDFYAIKECIIGFQPKTIKTIDGPKPDF